MLFNYFTVFVFLAVGIVFVVGNLILSRMVHPRKYVKEKYIAYECGEDPVGPAWVQFNNRFYVVALIFLVFDVEIVFLFPWAVVFRELGMFAFIEMVIFVAVLLIGLAYIWARGDLDWIKPTIRFERTPTGQPRVTITEPGQ